MCSCSVFLFTFCSLFFFSGLGYGHELLLSKNDDIKVKEHDKKRVIVDVDIGGDDLLAVLILLYAEQLGILKIEAIVCTSGNTDLNNSVRNAVRLLETVNRTDIPLFKGVNEAIFLHPVKTTNHYGKDGLGDLKYSGEPDLSIVKNGLAAEAIYNLVSENPGQISYLALAPLTNLALTGKLYGDFYSNLKDIWILGGNSAPRNSPTQISEFNFGYDPEAAQIVFEKGIVRPIYSLPWECFKKGNITFEWRFATLERKTPGIKLLTKAEESINFRATKKFWVLPDSMLAFCYVDPKKCISDFGLHNIAIELCDPQRRGWLLLDILDAPKNVTVIKAIDEAEFQKFLVNVSQNV